MAKIRSEIAGTKMAESILETVNLMYQQRTALYFLKGLIYTLLAEYIKRRRNYKYNAKFYDLEAFLRKQNASKTKR